MSLPGAFEPPPSKALGSDLPKNALQGEQTCLRSINWSRSLLLGGGLGLCLDPPPGLGTGAPLQCPPRSTFLLLVARTEALPRPSMGMGIPCSLSRGRLATGSADTFGFRLDMTLETWLAGSGLRVAALLRAPARLGGNWEWRNGVRCVCGGDFWRAGTMCSPPSP